MMSTKKKKNQKSKGLVRRVLGIVMALILALAAVMAGTNALVLLSTRADIAYTVDNTVARIKSASGAAAGDGGAAVGGGAASGDGARSAGDNDSDGGSASSDAADSIGSASGDIDGASGTSSNAPGTGYLADAIVVLGASVRPNGQPSPILRDRIDAGIELYWAGVAPKIIMSGDNSTETYNESWAMKSYAVDKGVPAEDIFCDHAGFSTYESMYRAKYVFGVGRLVVSTQSYHLPRALYAAKGLGMQAWGYASDKSIYPAQFYYDMREIPARTKDVFKTLLKVPSTFVGDFISLNQSGNVTD